MGPGVPAGRWLSLDGDGWQIQAGATCALRSHQGVRRVTLGDRQPQEAWLRLEEGRFTVGAV